MSLVLTYAAQESMLDDVTVAASGSLGLPGTFASAKVNVYIEKQDPAPNLVLADLTPATYTGHGAQTVTWSSLSRREDGAIVLDGNLHVFQPSDDVTPNTAYGLYYTDSTGVTLLGMELLNGTDGISLSDELSAVRVVPQLAVGGSDNGSATVID